ncbi:hemerythrin domain-containing protein [Mycolicibacterium mengxianglii]|nr:hemerythrin domain-containing protein [Mycolicibacterium mengxianglii]
MVHRMFRREFGLAPGVVRRVRPGDPARAAVVAGHLRLVGTLLHHHHAGEDEQIWPLLLDRAALNVARIRDVERQHRDVELARAVMADALDKWCQSADAHARERLATTLESLNATLVEHMDYEERHVVPPMEQHVERAEWDRVIQAMAAGIEPNDLLLTLGMTTYEGDADTIERTFANMPPALGPSPRTAAEAAYARHAEVVHGTATPPRTAELRR